ncbi:hypothetical protein [Streptomyces sp. NPDC058145]|uniref:hypothetical protein n=1 Tax=Streptomyces sp. NPDC058145 TaxID=3346356 RepID=UPI0036E96CBC
MIAGEACSSWSWPITVRAGRSCTSFQGVALAQQLHDEVELRAGRLRAAGDVEVDVVAVDAVAEECVDMMIRVLVGVDVRQ